MYNGQSASSGRERNKGKSFGSTFGAPAFGPPAPAKPTVRFRTETKTRSVPVTRTRTETKTRQVLVDGKMVTQSYQVQVPYTENVAQSYTVQVPYYLEGEEQGKNYSVPADAEQLGRAARSKPSALPSPCAYPRMDRE